MFALPVLTNLTNDEVVAQLKELMAHSHELTAEILVHLAEVEARELHLRAACGSMFAYTTTVLGFDEGAAYKRITAARLGRRFPRVLEVLAQGQLHLAGIAILGPHLTEDNHRELLEQATGKSKRQIEVLVATLAPKTDVPTQVRKLPAPAPPWASGPASSAAQPTLALSEPKASAPATVPNPAPTASTVTPHRFVDRPVTKLATKPLSEDRFKVTFTASASLADKLAQCKALLGHREPGCDESRVVELAIDMLHAQLVKQRFGAGAKPRATKAAAEHTRHVPKEVRREVVARDGLSCSFRDPKTGRRCGSQDRLELQHHAPFALGGAHSTENISVFCRAHNAHAARRDFGPERIEAAIRARERDRSASSSLSRAFVGTGDG